jgi:hypothetical protein
MSEFVLLGGERYLRIEAVARWYRVDIAFLEEAVALELLESEQIEERERMVPERALDRLAELLRWRWQTDLDLEALALLLRPTLHR